MKSMKLLKSRNSAFYFFLKNLIIFSVFQIKKHIINLTYFKKLIKFIDSEMVNGIIPFINL